MHAEPLSSIDLPSHLQAITHALDALAPMEPDPAKVDEIWRRFRDEVLAHVDAELRILAPDDRDVLEAATAMLANELASLLDATGDRLGCSEARRAARHFARTEDLGREVEASEADPAGYRTLLAARAAYRQELFGTGDALLKKLQTTSPALRKLVDQALDGLRPMTGAPSLFTFNSIGTMLWGERDRWPDGSYVATLCAVVGFMPVFPIASYRVTAHGDSYTFYAKTRLSRFARLVQVGVVASMVLGLAGLVGLSWWKSPARRAAAGMEEAAALEGPAQLLRYEELLREYGASASNVVTPAAVALVDDALGHVQEPMTAAHVDEAERVVLRVESLPAGHHQVTPKVLEALERWRTQLGNESLDDAEAGARLAALGSRLAGSARAHEVERDAAIAVANRLVEEWPLAALERYSDYAAFPAAATRMAPIVDRLEGDATWCAVGAAIERWLPYADERGAVARGKLEAARVRCASPTRQAALEGGEAELRAALDAAPDDLGLRAALADTLRFEGKLEEARVVFGDVAPGWLPPDALISYAMLRRDLGDLDAAAHLLDRHVKDHLSRYQRSIRAYDTFADNFFEQIDESYRHRREPELEERLRGASDEEAFEIFQAYALERLMGHGRTATLREEIERESAVVPAALALGTLQLERAARRDGEEREALVREAERVFLAIRQDAEGAPEYHLGLGQVHHRLGRRAEGDAELDAVADRDPTLRLEVVEVYRHLNLTDLAKSHAQRAYEEGDDEVKGTAAMLLAHLATDLDEEERWWQRAPQDLVAVRLGLRSVRGDRALRDGDFDAAATHFRAIAEAHAETADHDPVSANNGAIAWGQVYSATGEDAALDRAVELLEQSVRRRPDNAIGVSNLAGHHLYRGNVRILSRYFRTSALRLDGQDAGRLLDALLAGSEREAIVEAMRRDPSLRRASELWRRAIVLSPTMAHAYHYEIDRAEALGDQEAAQAMRERMRQVDFGASGGRSYYEASWRGEHDETAREDVTRSLTRAEGVLAAAEHTQHARTIAAAKLLAADAAFAYAGTVSDLAQAVRAADRYAELAADGLFDPYLEASPRLLEAVLKASESSPALRVRWEERRRLGVVYFVAELRAHPEARDALRARPEAAAAAELFLRHGNGVDVVRWALGDALNHPGLSAANVAAKSDPNVRHRLEAEAAVSPWRQDLQLQLGWF